MKKILFRSIFAVVVLSMAACSAGVSQGYTSVSGSSNSGSLLEEVTPTPEATPETTTEPQDTITTQTRVSEKDKMDEILIPAGEFIMGAEDDPEAKQVWEGGRSAPEIPSFKYTLPDYWIDKYEVTNQQWALCVADGACKDPVPGIYTPANYFTDEKYANYPVTSISWYSASDYCKWAGRRLPTEAEWEKAARGTDGRMYPWGNEPVDGTRANFCDKDCPRLIANPNYDDGYPEMAPVGSYPKGASPYGVMDMSGNVWEWTSTIIQAYPYNADDGREDQSMRAERVWRGGPWSNGTWWMRSSIRYRSVPTYYISNLGVRCASSD